MSGDYISDGCECRPGHAPPRRHATIADNPERGDRERDEHRVPQVWTEQPGQRAVLHQVPFPAPLRLPGLRAHAARGWDMRSVRCGVREVRADAALADEARVGTGDGAVAEANLSLPGGHPRDRDGRVLAPEIPPLAALTSGGAPHAPAAEAALPARDHLAVVDVVWHVAAQGVQHGLRRPADAGAEPAAHVRRNHVGSQQDLVAEIAELAVL